MAVYMQKGGATLDIREEELKSLVLDTIKATGKNIKFDFFKSFTFYRRSVLCIRKSFYRTT